MKSRKIILAVVFSLLLIVGMMPIMPQAAYAEDISAAKAQLTKPAVETAEPIAQADQESWMLEHMPQMPEFTEPDGSRGPIGLDSVMLSLTTPAAGVRLSAWVKDEDGNFPDPNEYTCEWSYKDSGGWVSIPDQPDDIGNHGITVPGYALGKPLKVVATPKTSSYNGTATITTGNVVSSRLDYIDVFVTGTGYYVGGRIEPQAFYRAEGYDHYIDHNYIHFDYYVGEGNSWTQIPEGLENNDYAYLTFGAEGKFFKVVAHVMADQEDVLGGPCTWVSDERAWELPLDDNFHDETLPSCWISLDVDGDGQGWISLSGNSLFPSLSGEYDGECVGSASYISDTGHINNWLISPSVYIPQFTTNLYYYVTGSWPDDFAEHYAVYISTNPEFDLNTFVKVDEGTTLFDCSYELKEVNISEYAGKNVYIAFRHFDCTPDQFYLCLDGVSIDGPLTRVYGSNRYKTSIDVANRFMQVKGLKELDEVIVATGDAFPDALSGSTYSVAYNAPVILISPKSKATQEAALNFIENNLSYSGNVVLLGGTGAVPQEFEDAIRDMIDYTDQHMGRLEGNDRFGTNLEVLKALPYLGDSILVCDATNYADAATASATGRPVLLVGKNGLTADQKAFLNSISKRQIYVIGGEGAVTKAVYDELKAYDVFGSPTRIWGNNRALTAVEVAKEFFPEGSELNTVVFAYGGNYPDCISGGLLANTLRAPILYGDGGQNASYFSAADPYFQLNQYIKRAFMLGGPALVSDAFALSLLAKG